MKVAAVQFQHQANELAANFAIIRRYAVAASKIGVRLISFPECCLTGYWHLRHLNRKQLEGLAEQIPDGVYSVKIRELANDLNLTIGVGLLEMTKNGRLFNSYFVANPGGTYACHRKIHCFINSEIDSGDDFTVFSGPDDVPIGVLICYDNNIIENVRMTALQGARVLLAPHQTGGCNSGSPFAMGIIPRKLWDDRAANPDAIEAELRGDKGRGWLMRWLPSRAHDNGLFLVFSNGIGPDDDEVRTGNSMIIDPYGRIIEETWAAGDEMVVADLDLSLQERATGTRWIRARRPGLYGLLTKQMAKVESTRDIRFEHLEDNDL